MTAASRNRPHRRTDHHLSTVVGLTGGFAAAGFASNNSGLALAGTLTGVLVTAIIAVNALPVRPKPLIAAFALACATGIGAPCVARAAPRILHSVADTIRHMPASPQTALPTQVF